MTPVQKAMQQQAEEQARLRRDHSRPIDPVTMSLWGQNFAARLYYKFMKNLLGAATTKIRMHEDQLHNADFWPPR